MVQAAQVLEPGALIDGEIVIADDSGRSDFGALQSAYQRPNASAAAAVERPPDTQHGEVAAGRQHQHAAAKATARSWSAGRPRRPAAARDWSTCYTSSTARKGIRCQGVTRRQHRIVRLTDGAAVYVIAVTNSALPPTQTPQIFGCYPSSASCAQS